MCRADRMNRDRYLGEIVNEQQSKLKQQGYVLVDEALPPTGHTVTVVTDRFRCIGFLDPQMNWRYMRDHGPIHNVVAWGVLNLDDSHGS